MIKRIGSKELWFYLSERGLLNASDEAITVAKADYRRKYKREWKLRHKLPQKELRLIFSVKQYMELKVKALEIGLSPTKYIQEHALASIEATHIVPESHILKTTLQFIARASLSSEPKYLLSKAELLLLEYLKKHGAY